MRPCGYRVRELVGEFARDCSFFCILLWEQVTKRERQNVLEGTALSPNDVPTETQRVRILDVNTMAGGERGEDVCI